MPSRSIPNYAKNGHFYVHYNSPDGDTNVVRYTGKPGDGQVRTGTAKQLLRVNQPFENHNGGWLGFGPDERLYLALGDGGGNSPGDPLGNGQKRNQPLAKILRMDPDNGRYTTYAWGLRNPWRASFDRETGDLWIGDVGQDEIEEIDIVKAGRENPPNFGWSVMEGSQCHRGACDKGDYVLPGDRVPARRGRLLRGGRLRLPRRGAAAAPGRLPVQRLLLDEGLGGQGVRRQARCGPQGPPGRQRAGLDRGQLRRGRRRRAVPGLAGRRHLPHRRQGEGRRDEPAGRARAAGTPRGIRIMRGSARASRPWHAGRSRRRSRVRRLGTLRLSPSPRRRGRDRCVLTLRHGLSSPRP